jgi:hypothetical protein
MAKKQRTKRPQFSRVVITATCDLLIQAELNSIEKDGVTESTVSYTNIDTLKVETCSWDEWAENKYNVYIYPFEFKDCK